MAPRHVLLIDGVCVLCQRSAQFLRRRDRAGVLAFASLQGQRAQVGLAQLGVTVEPGQAWSTVYLVTDAGSDRARVWTRSDAALRALGLLGGGYRLLRPLAWVPRPVRDWVYRVIAARRYRWFGRLEACPMPQPADRPFFLADDLAPGETPFGALTGSDVR